MTQSDPADPADCFSTLLRRAVAHHQAGQLEAARGLYEQLLAERPDHADALNLLGTVHAQQNDLPRAFALMTQALAQRADSWPILDNLGTVCMLLNRPQEALGHFERALALQPGQRLLHDKRQRAHAACVAAQRAWLDGPDAAAASAAALLACGNALLALQEPALALRAYERAGERAAPQRAQRISALINAGVAQHALGRFDDALDRYDSALALDAKNRDAWFNKGLASQKLNRHDAAIACYDRALALQPDHAELHWNRALSLLKLGRFAEGWRDYEWRWRRRVFTSPRRAFRQPLWLGDFALGGKTILLHGEQGFGDSLQFCRYAAMVAARGARVVLEVQAPLQGLLGTLAGVDQVIARGTPLPDFDCHCPLLSLPLAFATGLSNIPAEVPYLHADAARFAVWQQRLGARRGPRVGIVWSGIALHGHDAERSLALDNFAAVLPAGMDVVCLQKDIRESDRAVLRRLPAVRVFAAELGDFADTAALLANMDLVVSVDTSVAHLAGALGKPLWLLLQYNPDWRWLLERDDSPWYPSARLYRQEALGDWQTVLTRLAADLRGWMAAG